MGSYDSEIIPSKVFIAVNSTLFGLALLMAAARIMIRYHFQRKLHSDDFVLMFACLTFIASQVLLYILKVDNVHRFGAVFFEPGPQTTASIYEDPEALYRSLSKVQHMEYSIGILTWTSIFAVKICFLLFFHQMILRTRRLLVAWRVIFGITIIFWVLCSCGFFMSCSRFGQAALSCLQGSGFSRNLAVSIMGAVLDIVSDLLLISLPLLLLWKVKMKRRQKIFLGIFLCLSVCMIIITAVRVLGFNIKSTYNVLWGLFWHQAEAAIAIMMVSIIAFRSLLGLKAQKAREEKAKERYWYTHRPKLLANNSIKTTEDESESSQLPSILDVAPTEIRTFVDGNGIWDDSMAMEVTHKFENDTVESASHTPQEIDVTHQIPSASKNFDGAERTRCRDNLLGM